VFAACVTGDAGVGDDDPSVGDDNPTPPDEPGGSGTALGASTSAKILPHDYQAQQTGYWCGPAASRIVLSTRMAAPTQGQLANELHTTTNGTDWIGQVTGVLDTHLGDRYATVEMPNDPPTPAQRDRLWHDVKLSIDAGHGMVANIVAPPSNHPPGYPNSTIYHYFAVVGYDPRTFQVHIADPANFQGNNHYWLSLDQLATLIPPKGYSTYRCGVGRTVGLIDEHYRALGGCTSFLGPALTDETATPDGVGRYNVFENGSMYWSPATGAHEVHGAIRDKWRDLGWEAGMLGYPTSDEYTVAGGRRSDFQRGSITWMQADGSITVTP
jgi:hypothetical protein